MAKQLPSTESDLLWHAALELLRCATGLNDKGITAHDNEIRAMYQRLRELAKESENG